MKNILITGGAGFIGYHLADCYSKKNYKVYILDNFFKRKSKDKEFINLIKRKNVFFYNIDLTKDFSKLKLKTRNFDIVYHFAAINGTSLFYEMPYEVCSSNILMTINLINWAKFNNIKKFIFSSSSEVYSQGLRNNLIKIPTPENSIMAFEYPFQKRISYGLSKLIGEFLFLNLPNKKKSNCCVVRFHNIYGPRMGFKHVIPEFIEKIKKNKNNLIICGGKQTRAFCYISDALEALIRLGKKNKINNETFNIGNPNQEVKIYKLANMIKKLMNKDLKMIDQGPPDGSVNRRSPNISKLKKFTKYQPKIKLNEGLKNTVSWYLEELKK